MRAHDSKGASLNKYKLIRTISKIHDQREIMNNSEGHHNDNRFILTPNNHHCFRLDKWANQKDNLMCQR